MSRFQSYISHLISRLPNLLCLLYLVCCISSCKKAEDITVKSPKPERELSGPVGKVMHFYSDTVYHVLNNIPINEGERLIIDEGTLIKMGVTGSITVNAGGNLLANGTASNPIVFTSIDSYGSQDKNWPGITIRGKSFNNAISQTGDATDFSCSLKYVRIEFGALTLEGVGNKSIVENIQVSYTKSQSSFKFYGGAFNARNLISYACGGQADFYLTKGYSGSMQNILAYRHPFVGNTAGNGNYNNYDNVYNKNTAGILIENNPDDSNAQPYTFPVISNVTVIGPHIQNGLAPEYLNTALRSGALVTTQNARFKIRNSVFTGFPVSGWYLDDQQTALNFNSKIAELGFSVFHCTDTARTFQVNPSAVPGLTASQFKKFVLEAGYAKESAQGADFMYKDPFNYENIDLTVKDAPLILSGANFEGIFANPFFNKVSYIGAIGNDNWLQGWVNFTPLRTNYNNPQ